MKMFLSNALLGISLCLMPHLIFGQVPNLGSTSDFALFTAVGQFENTGSSAIIGDIGTDVGAFLGFPPGVVNGAIHVADAVSAQAAIDVDVAYAEVDNYTCGSVLGTSLGNGQLLTPDIYCLGAASILNGQLTLDAEGNPDAIFIFQIDGALSVGAFSSIILLNGASSCNVYWQINGAFHLANGSVFIGTALVNGAIDLLGNAMLIGRALSRVGAISTESNMVTLVLPAVPSVIMANGPTSLCLGDSVILSGNVGGVWNNGATTPNLTVTTAGDYFVTNTTDCGSAISNHIIVTVNLLPVCNITGSDFVCAGQVIDICAPPGLAAYAWSTGETTPCISVDAAGTYFVTITDANGCESSCSKTVGLNPLPVCNITGADAICQGQSTEICAPAGAASYLWSTGQAADCITVNTAGTYFVTITDANGCESSCSKTILLNPLPVCNITGANAICQGQSIDICAPAGAAAYSWSTGETTDCISVDAGGTYFVTITDANGCISSCSKTVILNLLPVCSITGPDEICQGQVTDICAPAGLAAYSWSTGEITPCITIDAAGTYFLTITDANGCTSSCSKTIGINPVAVCNITGPDAICLGQSAEICVPAGAASYLWSTGAISNCITVNAAGTYSVTVTDANGCTSSCSKTIGINPVAVCNITGPDAICLGQSADICVPAGAASYLWSTGAIGNCITVNAAGTYLVTVTDALGCTSSCSKTIGINPIAACNITGLDAICLGQSTEICVPAGAASYLWSTGAVSNCITVNTTGTYSVTVTDANGCTSSCSKTIGISAGELSIACPADLTIDCDDSTLPANTGTAVATDNCSLNTSVNFSDLITAGLCPQSYTITRTWIATSPDGSTIRCDQIITVLDSSPPVIACPADVTLSCTDNTSPQMVGLATAVDNCDPSVEIRSSDLRVAGSCPQAYTIIRTWTATDMCGNSSSCVQTLTIEDNTAPTLVCPANVTVSCLEDVPAVNVALMSATDNCMGMVTVTHVGDVISGQTCASRLVISRTYRATDVCGNTASCVQVITVADNTAPDITCPANLVVACATEVPPVDLTLLAATDNCGGLLSVVHVGDVVTNQICENRFTLTRTYRATDLCGNTVSCIQTITVDDQQPPVIVFTHPLIEGLPNGGTFNVQCEGQDPDWMLPVLDENSVEATDECLGEVVVLFMKTLESTGNCENGYINRYRLNWTATDICGNSSTAFLFMALVDTIAPLIYGVPADTIMNCNDIPEAPTTIYAIDECLCACIVLLEESTILPGCLSGQVLLRTWTATDDCGNQSTYTQRITFIDDEAPVLVGVLDTTCAGDPNLNGVFATDNCGLTYLNHQDVEVPNPCGSGTAIERRYEVSDECGNIARDTTLILPNEPGLLAIVFVDSVLAAMAPGEVMTINCFAHDGQHTSFDVHDARLDDACLSGGSMSFTERVLSTADCSTDGLRAVISLEWTAVDVCGNSTSRTITVNLVDETSPTFVNFVPEITIGCNDEWPTISAIDNCGEVVMAIRDSVVNGACAFEYDVYRLATATDACGNTSIQQQILHVGDGSGPTISGIVENVCDDLSLPAATAYDSCASEFVPLSMSQDTLAACGDGLVIERTWTAINSCGDTSVVRQIISMNDHTAPEIEIPANSVISFFQANVANLVLASYTSLLNRLDSLRAESVLILDDCDEGLVPVFSVVVTHSDYCDIDGYYERRVYTWVATDACGNATTFTFTVDIMDDVAPVFEVVPTDLTIVCAPLPPASDLQVIDWDQNVSVVYTETTSPGAEPGVYIVTRTWVATDACGNTTTVVQHITWIPDSLLDCSIVMPTMVSCNTHGVRITSEITGGLGELTYEWVVVGDECFLQTGQGTPEITIYVGWSEVTITLIVTDAFGCVSVCTTTLNCNSTTGDLMDIISPPQGGDLTATTTPARAANVTFQDFKLWPNPARDYINMGFESATGAKVEVSLINLLGQVVLTQKLQARVGANLHRIDVSDIQEGSYLIQAKTEQEVIVKIVLVSWHE